MKRILANSEASFLNTGYGNYFHEILKRIYSNYGDRFEIAELASYASPEDPRCNQVPWRVYPVMPGKDEKEYQHVYERDGINQFGKVKWEPTCLDWKPDTIFSIRDAWYEKFVIFSPYRRFYNIAWMVTCDSYPNNEEWIDDYRMSDAILTYTDWATDVLKYQGNKKLNLQGIAPAGADENIFRPLPGKSQLKQMAGLHPDTLVIGMVARNQMRKQFPDLFEGFAKFLVEGPRHLTGRTVLYLHTAWPDLGWDIPTLLKDFGLGNKVIFTYVCRNPGCGTIFSSFFQDAKGICKKCGKCEATIVNSHHGVPNHVLNTIYNLMDVYVQMSRAEGQGISIVEAAFAGLPTMTVNYSGMEDYVNKIGTVPINVKKFHQEVTTGRYFAEPDTDDFIKKLTDILSLPSSLRQSYGFKSRELAKIHFNWDISTKKWIEVFDSLPNKNWQEPGKLIQPNLNLPQGLNNEQFVHYCMINVLCRPDLINSYMALRTIRDLNWGHYTPSNTSAGLYYSEENVMNTKVNFVDFNRDICIREFLKIVDNYNNWESIRIKKLGL